MFNKHVASIVLLTAMPLFLTTDKKVSPSASSPQSQATESMIQEDTFKLSTMGELKQFFITADSAYQQAHSSADKIRMMQEVFDYYKGNYTGEGATSLKTSDEKKLFALLMAHADRYKELTTEEQQAQQAERFRLDLAKFWENYRTKK
ncbi:MAG: hypothetical protein QE263_04745 [Vampirovibrionales bacterium]|nr:hypothetical protein [Vampirovibrionales bacterium]